ncbi:phosphate ABC transporter substrate-binding protein PstS [Gulosibacter sp. 10]|uniref:phosphate ABC transporter substrate-binding protein PstS n=1 Tax=Gulosibacter sp. 10 TaxID=1255570 RepID=UPI0034E9506B
MTAIAALALVGCSGGGEPAATTSVESQGLSGELNATGASSQELAQLNAWTTEYKNLVEPEVTVNYTATGSGTGRDNFVAGQSDFIGSDRAFDLEEIESSEFPLCAEGSDLVEFPAYISPIAIAYNLPSVEELNLDAEVLAGIFAGEITTWNDPAIAALNEGAELPDTAINPVHRGDASGTTGNFLGYLEAAAPDAWTHGAEDEFPASLGGEAAQQTAGVAQAVGAGEGAIGYLDASAAADLQVASIKSGEDFVAYTPEAAAEVVAGSPLEGGRADTDIAFELDYTGVEGGYPIVLVSYLIGCAEYADAAKGELVKSYFSYVISPEAQDAAAEEAGSAPISDEIREQAQAAIDTIK